MAAQIDLIDREQRRVIIRIIRAYRTVPWEAACAVSGQPPWLMVANQLSDMFYRKQKMVRLREGPTRENGRGAAAPVPAARDGQVV